MISEPYLIAHVVRGSPAFDIATRCDDMGTESDPGPWWIIPTSGHRAYPYAQCKLYSISLEQFLSTEHDVPANWPDHYAANDRHRIKAIDEDTLLAKETAKPGTGIKIDITSLLGITKPKPPTITRR